MSPSPAPSLRWSVLCLCCVLHPWPLQRFVGWDCEDLEDPVPGTPHKAHVPGTAPNDPSPPSGKPSPPSDAPTSMSASLGSDAGGPARVEGSGSGNGFGTAAGVGEACAAPAAWDEPRKWSRAAAVWALRALCATLGAETVSEQVAGTKSFLSQVGAVSLP